MTTTAEKIAVMQAFERGDKVEFRTISGGWAIHEDPSWNWSNTEYRVAPKPIDLVEVLREMGTLHGVKQVYGHTWADIIARAKELQG